MITKAKVKNIKGLNLTTVVHSPNKESKYPAIILLHGFKGYKEEENIIQLATDSAENGFVAIRFDASVIRTEQERQRKEL